MGLPVFLANRRVYFDNRSARWLYLEQSLDDTIEDTDDRNVHTSVKTEYVSTTQAGQHAAVSLVVAGRRHGHAVAMPMPGLAAVQPCSNFVGAVALL